MSVKLITKEQTFNNGAIQKSKSSNKLEALWDDTFYQFTTDGGGFSEAFMFMDNSVMQIGHGGSGFSFIDVTSAGIINFGSLGAGQMKIFKDNNITGGLKGKITIGQLPIFADNTAALAGNLASKDLYTTATGEMRMVV